MRDNGHEKERGGGTGLVSRARLKRRWRCGSGSSFWRAEADGLLVPRRRNGRVRYAWADVWAYEGGQPPSGQEAAYRADLLTPEEVAARADMTAARIAELARRGEIPARRVGSKWRFVPAEVARWLAQAWQ